VYIKRGRRFAFLDLLAWYCADAPLFWRRLARPRRLA
jgi:hypothetical protein